MKPSDMALLPLRAARAIYGAIRTSWDRLSMVQGILLQVTSETRKLRSAFRSKFRITTAIFGLFVVESFTGFEDFA